jgi:DNA-directed RNA polymerase delta subunit
MNFVDAAVTLLREANRPVHVEEICRLALERGLLDSPGQSPLRSLKGRLTTELKRGPDSRVVRVEDDVWALAAAAQNGEAAIEEEITAPEFAARIDEGGALGDQGAQVPVEAEAGGAPEAFGEAFEPDVVELDEDDDDDDDEDELDEDELDELDEDELDEDEDFDAYEGEDEAAAGAQPGEQANAHAEEHAHEDADREPDDARADIEVLDEELDTAAVDVDDDEDTQVREARASEEAERARLEREALSPDERELVDVYGEEAGTAGVGELVEYRDQQTADEDRPMVPEMLPERRGRQREDWKARRERMREKRRERREERERTKGGRDGQAAEGGAAPEAQPERGEEAVPAHRREAAAAAPDGDLARLACDVLASIKGAQPVPVKQLAQMLRKRRMTEVDPEALWRPLKSALLADHQRRAAAGLPPRIAHRGRDLFAYRPSANAELEAAETGLEAAAHRLRGATERALAARLVELPLPVLEQVVQLYLVQAGWRDVEWIKRVDRSGYALAREPGDGQLVMIAARAGNQQVDRRGVGELRAGVAAKNLCRGLLLAPRELGSEARSELERPGKPVSAMCGLPWAAALVGAGIGVALRMMPVAYLDPDLFDRLGES